ncbi:hypothetical protein [Pontitalea aquivivens]|uniref:hypothetical protein n=1 Tax=Pontitalea aquivivens TaxID=3388663 RepID=UPI0039705609
MNNTRRKSELFPDIVPSDGRSLAPYARLCLRGSAAGWALRWPCAVLQTLWFSLPGEQRWFVIGLLIYLLALAPVQPG